MAYPEPRPGLVIYYRYLWREEEQAGKVEGQKDRPCVIILSNTDENNETEVTVVPITHTKPKNIETALEIPLPVKTRMGLDSERSWAVLSEVNRFVWPGYDLRPIEPGTTNIEFGFLPPKLFKQITEKFVTFARQKRVALSQRD